MKIQREIKLDFFLNCTIPPTPNYLQENPLTSIYLKNKEINSNWNCNCLNTDVEIYILLSDGINSILRLIMQFLCFIHFIIMRLRLSFTFSTIIEFSPQTQFIRQDGMECLLHFISFQ